METAELLPGVNIDMCVSSSSDHLFTGRRYWNTSLGRKL